MAALNGKLKREHATLTRMTRIYCEGQHGLVNGDPCPRCLELLSYSEKRLAKCPYGENKPNCNRCPVHCYKQKQRDQVRAIMRYAGPRMMLRHPWRTFVHFVNKSKEVVHPMELRRARRQRGPGPAPTDTR
jgi:hypothetical protein